MRIVKIKDERMEPVHHEIQYGQRKHGPYVVEQRFALEAALVQIGDYVAYPCQHRKEHEYEIKDRKGIYDREERGNIVVFVKKTPRYISHEITDACYQKIPVATIDSADFILFPAAVDRYKELLPVNDQENDKSEYANG